jgi:hypothetical protein
MPLDLRRHVLLSSSMSRVGCWAGCRGSEGSHTSSRSCMRATLAYKYLNTSALGRCMGHPSESIHCGQEYSSPPAVPTNTRSLFLLSRPQAGRPRSSMPGSRRLVDHSRSGADGIRVVTWRICHRYVAPDLTVHVRCAPDHASCCFCTTASPVADLVLCGLHLVTPHGLDGPSRVAAIALYHCSAEVMVVGMS